jgi:predicted PP-loop superfamily ATPase
MQTTLFAETSRDAYAAQTPDKLSRDHRAIVDYVTSQHEHGATRFEIHRATGIKYTTVCGRCNELVTDGKLLSTKRRRKTDTGATAYVLVAPNP